MTCYFPLHAFKGKSKDADKIAITFRRSDSWRGVELDLPCGQCIGCRLERARCWAVRCTHEASLYDKNCFLTLTYSDENLPPGGSLCLKDHQDFMKRLRKRYGAGIRFFMCGEYGEELGRPHFHYLLFNHDFSDRKLFSGNRGNPLYTSAELSELWPYGHSLVGEVTFESAGYVARYALKKVTGERSAEHYGGLKPEFTTMSRGCKRLGTGGIGKAWFDRYKSDVYPLDRVVVRGAPTRPPRFYDTLLGREDRSTLELLKIDREKNGQHFVEDVLSDGTRVQVSDSCDARLVVKEIVKRASISALKRPLEEVI